MRTLALAVAPLFLAGCASYKASDLVLPEAVTVTEALHDITCAFHQLKVPDQDKVGLMPAELKVTLELSVSAKDGGKLTVAPSRTVPATVIGTTGGFSAEKSGEANSSRGSTIELTFKSMPMMLLEKVASEHGKTLTVDKVRDLVALGKTVAPLNSGRPMKDAGSQIDCPPPKKSS